METVLGNMEGDSFTGTLMERWIIRGWGRSVYWKFWKIVKGAPEREHLYLRELCQRNLDAAFFAGDPERYGIWGGGLMGLVTLSVGAPLGSLEGGSSTGDLWRLWRWVTLSIGAPLGNPDGGSYTGKFERWMKEGSRDGASLSEGALWGEPGGRAPLLVTPNDMLNKALEMGVCFHKGPTLENMEGRSFLKAFQRREKFLYLWKFLWVFWERCKQGTVNMHLSL